MKRTIYLLGLCTVFCCGERKATAENQELPSELTAFEEKISIEDSTKQLIEEYLNAVNSPDWKTKSAVYLRGADGFLEEHEASRKSFPNYMATAKHMTIDGSEGLVWLKITAT